jgi:nicotinamidase-related amidase
LIHTHQHRQQTQIRFDLDALEKKIHHTFFFFFLISEKTKIQSKREKKMTSVGLLRRQTSTFLLCDVQERFRSHIGNMESVLHVGKTMLGAAEQLDIETIVTEQYPRGLGHTVAELDIGSRKRVALFEKSKFSMLTDDVRDHLGDDWLERDYVLFGIEAHVCVLQTALELRSHGAQVQVLVDGTSSRHRFERHAAFKRMAQEGVRLTTCESALFQLLHSANDPDFRRVQSLFLGERPATGLDDSL